MAAVAPSTVSQMCCKTAWPRDRLEDQYPFSHHLGTDNKDKTSLLLHIQIWVNNHQATVISHQVGYTLENSKEILRFKAFVSVLLQMWHCVVGWEVIDILKDHFYYHFTQTPLRLLDSEAGGTVISQNTATVYFSHTSQQTPVFSNVSAICAPVQVQRPDFCPLTGHNPGSWLAFLLDITPWEDIFT